ncbi:hypothetical protein OROMI_033572 [Orobanche minor]
MTKRKLDPATSKHGMQLRSRSRYISEWEGMNLRSGSRYVPPKPEPRKVSVAARPIFPLQEEAEVSWPQVYIRRYGGDDPALKRQNKVKRRAWILQSAAWMKQQQNKRLKDRRIHPTGLTPMESGLVRPYLMKQSFEVNDQPVPEEHQRFNNFLHQVRRNPYEVKVAYQANPYLGGFRPLERDVIEKAPKIKKHLEDGIGMVKFAIRKKLGQAYTVDDGYNNFVRIKWHYLLSLGVKDPAGTPQTVEAYLAWTPVKPLRLLEWKIKQDSELIHCSARII